MSTSALSWRLRSPAILHYAIAGLSVAAALAANLLLVHLAWVGPSLSLFLCAIMFAAWSSGTGPALLAIALTVFVFNYFFVAPVHSFALEFKDMSGLALFAVAAIFVVSLFATQRRAAESLRRVRDEQQVTLSELQRLNETLRIENIERRRAEERARRTEREFQVTIDTIPALAARYRPDGSMDFVNQTWRSYTGLSQDSLGEHRWGAAIHPEDLPLVELGWAAHLVKGEPFEMEQRLRRADGEYRRHWVRRVPLRDDDGNVIAWYGAGYDIEDRKRAEIALHGSEAELAEARRELQLTIDSIPAFVAAYEPDGTRSYVNKTWQNYTGVALGDATGERGKTSFQIHSEDAERADIAWRAALASGKPLLMEVRLRGADGTYRWYAQRRAPLHDKKGNIVKWYSVGFDIEEQKRAEIALRKSEAQLAQAQHELQLTIATIPAMVATYQPDGTRDFINQPWLDYAGLTRQEAEGEGRKSPVHPDDAKRVQDAWRASLASGEPFLTEVRVRAANGDYRWHTIRRVPRRDEKGDVVKWYGVGHDIDDQKKSESALRRGEAQLAAAKRELQATIDTIPTLIASYWPNGERDFVNLAWERFTGISQEEARGKSSTITFHPDRQAPGESEWRACLAKGEAYEVEERLRRADGEYRWHWIGRVPLRDENGDVTKWYGVGHDIEDRKRAESALQRSRAYLAEAQKLSQTGSFAWGDVNDDHFWSDQTYEIFGVDRSVRPSVEIVAQRVHPDDRLIFEHEVRRAERGARKHDYELRLLMPDGATKHLHIVSHRIKYESGKEELVGAMMDVTEARKSQETLHAAQSALHHASRVATLGEISATIAHEVNQPLAAIVTNGQACLRILRSESPDLDDVRGAVDWIVKDGNRAGEVIRRVRGLMKKADAQQVPLDVNDMISEVAALLQGELAAQHVSLRLDLAPSMALAAADRIQLQQVIINLIMNGIEAMQTVADRPRALVIRSHQDEAGRVAVAVKDGGIGIPADTADRLFEAFFSTKPSGLGMGLSICRSIIEDHGGRLWARDNNDEPGATFQFALPSLRDSMA